MDPLEHMPDRLRRAVESEPAKQVVSVAEEFRQFAFKGNVVDLAIGVIIGAAFGKVVDSLVKSVIMPLVGIFLPGDEGYKGWKWIIRGQEVPYGQFLGEIVNFLIVALVLFFFLVKFLGWLTHSQKAQAPPLTREQELLTEIRDLLKKQQQTGTTVSSPPSQTGNPT